MSKHPRRIALVKIFMRNPDGLSPQKKEGQRRSAPEAKTLLMKLAGEAARAPIIKYGAAVSGLTCSFFTTPPPSQPETAPLLTPLDPCRAIPISWLIQARYPHSTHVWPLAMEMPACSTGFANQETDPFPQRLACIHKLILTFPTPYGQPCRSDPSSVLQTVRLQPA